MKKTVYIYAKPPIIGLSKTRLAGGVGAAEAQRIARWSFEKTLRAADDSRWNTILATTPDKYLNDTLGGLWPASLERMSQGGGGLTDRLNKGLAAAPAGQVVFIGADCPDITNGLIADAFGELKANDAVFGPATDGGFWLFGMNKRSRSTSPFRDVRWSTQQALADVRENLPPATKVAYLPELTDIDTAEDLHNWRDGAASNAYPASAPGADGLAQSVQTAASTLAGDVKNVAGEAVGGGAKKRGFFAKLFGSKS